MLGDDETKQGRTKVYSDDNILKLLMIMIMNQIPTFKGLHRYLQQNPGILQNCGMDHLPSRRTLGRRLKRFMPLWARKDTVKKPNIIKPEKSESFETPINLKKNPISIYYKNLKVIDPKRWTRICPFCKDGILAVVRSRNTFEIKQEDRCLNCAQTVVYLDIDEMRKKDKGI